MTDWDGLFSFVEEAGEAAADRLKPEEGCNCKHLPEGSLCIWCRRLENGPGDGPTDWHVRPDGAGLETVDVRPRTRDDRDDDDEPPAPTRGVVP